MKVPPKSKYQLPCIHILLCFPVAHYNGEKYTKATTVLNSPIFSVCDGLHKFVFK